MKVHKRDSNEVLSRKVERNVSVILFFTCFCCLHFVQFLSFYIIALTIQSILPYSLLEVKSFPDFLHFPDKISSSGTKFFLICRILFDVRFKYFRMAHNFSFLKLHKLVIYMVHSKPDFIVVHYPITFLQNVSFCSTLWTFKSSINIKIETYLHNFVKVVLGLLKVSDKRSVSLIDSSYSPSFCESRQSAFEKIKSMAPRELRDFAWVQFITRTVQFNGNNNSKVTSKHQLWRQVLGKWSDIEYIGV